VDYDRLRELQEKFDENPRRYFAPLANEYRKGGQPKRAIEICRAHLAQMPGHMSGQIVYGQALFEAGEWDEAKTVFERALTLDPENLIALRSLGDMALQAGNTSDARTWYSRLLDADPKDAAVIELMTELDESREAAASPVDDIPVDTTLGDQQIPTAVEQQAEAAEPATESEIRAQVEAAPVASESVHAEEPAGLERHYPTESLEEPALAELPVAETGEALEAVTSAIQDVPNALEPSPSSSTLPASAESATAAKAPDMSPGFAQPAPAAEPFVNETMAQLYLQQGYRQLALSVYRQLSVSRPQDQGLKARIAEIEAADAADHPGEVPAMRRDEPSIETPAEPAMPRSPAIESPSFDRSPVDSPPTAPPSRDRESIEAPTRDDPRAEPEGVAAREPSIREFFATLGRRRPPRATGTSGIRSPNRAPETAPSPGNPVPGASLDSVFAGATVSPSDARAASRLAGAFSGAVGGSGKTPPTPAIPTPRVNPRMPQAQESEEDVAKFRAWLDGLTRE
jgi:tetratricopeptide (TPR) repeat protein